jgi:hypothetical protein
LKEVVYAAGGRNYRYSIDAGLLGRFARPPASEPAWGRVADQSRRVACATGIPAALLGKIRANPAG